MVQKYKDQGASLRHSPPVCEKKALADGCILVFRVTCLRELSFKRLRMKKYLNRILIVLSMFFFGLLFQGCERSRERIVEISFTLNALEDYSRSDQLVIWLEKPDGTFVKTLFISEYLSYGGYNNPDICPDWSLNADWEMASQEEFDAVTGATPSIGPVDMQFSIPPGQLAKGEYVIFVAVHLIEDYNEIYRMKFLLSKKADSGKLEVIHKPGKYHRATYDVLSELRVNVQ